MTNVERQKALGKESEGEIPGKQLYCKRCEHEYKGICFDIRRNEKCSCATAYNRMIRNKDKVYID